MIAPTQGFVLVLLALIVLGVGGFFWRSWMLYRLLRLGRNEDRSDQPARRLLDEIVIYLGQAKLLNIGYHLRIAGRPARIATLTRVLEYLKSLGDDVWIARRDEIARFWREHYPQKESS